MIENNVGHFEFEPNGAPYRDINPFEQIVKHRHTQDFLQAVCTSLYNNPPGTSLKIEQDGVQFEFLVEKGVRQMLLNFWRYDVSIVSFYARTGTSRTYYRDMQAPKVLVYRPGTGSSPCSFCQRNHHP